MRIRNSGSGIGGGGGSSSRSDSFRRKHRIGQKVRGTLLKNVEDNMAWVEINGDRLLAQLEIRHTEGTRLVFIIKQLTPHIVLKELSDRHAGGAGAFNLVKDFDTARALFESRFKEVFGDYIDPIPLNFYKFIDLIASSPPLYACYKDAALCAADLSNILPDGAGRFLYHPWLAPYSRRQVTLIRDTSTTELTEAIVEYDHAKMGLVRAEFLHKGTQVACKLKIQHMGQGQPLLRYLGSRKHPELPTTAEGVSVTKLPSKNHGGIVAEMLLKQ